MYGNRVLCLGAAVLAPVVTVVLGRLLGPWLAPYGSLPLLILPVSFSAWCGGLWCGVIALVVSTALSVLCFLPPVIHPLCGAPVSFLVASLPIIMFSELLHVANRRLKTQADRLGSTDREKNQMIALLAHELRNPLSVASNALHLIGRRGGAEISRPHEIAERSLQQMGRLIDDLLDVSRISRGKIELHYDSVDVRLLLSEMCEAWEAAASAKHLTLRLEAPPGPILVFGDSMRLSQVFANLVGNAIKFTDMGEVALLLTVGRREVEVRIRDTGMGIANPASPHLWEPFRQGGVEGARGGLGLGLSVVKGLVELHGGTVTCQSDGVGKGATFTVELPLEEGLIKRRASHGEMDHPRAHGSGRGDTDGGDV